MVWECLHRHSASSQILVIITIAILFYRTLCWMLSMSCFPVAQVVCDDHGSRGFGFVHFETHEAAQNAIRTMNGMLLNDRKV